LDARRHHSQAGRIPHALARASHNDPYLALEVAAVANMVKSDTVLERNTELQQRFLELAKADWKRQSDIPILESSVRVIAIYGIRALVVDIAGERKMRVRTTVLYFDDGKIFAVSMVASGDQASSEIARLTNSITPNIKLGPQKAISSPSPNPIPFPKATPSPSNPASNQAANTPAAKEDQPVYWQHLVATGVNEKGQTLYSSENASSEPAPSPSESEQALRKAWKDVCDAIGTKDFDQAVKRYFALERALKPKPTPRQDAANAAATTVDDATADTTPPQASSDRRMQSPFTSNVIDDATDRRYLNAITPDAPREEVARMEQEPERYFPTSGRPEESRLVRKPLPQSKGPP
jgi:hypothetical protein